MNREAAARLSRALREAADAVDEMAREPKLPLHPHWRYVGPEERASLAAEAECVTPSGRTDGHMAYVEGDGHGGLRCTFCKKGAPPTPDPPANPARPARPPRKVTALERAAARKALERKGFTT